MRLRELKELRAKAIAAARGFLDAATAEKRDMTAEEDASYSKAIEDGKTHGEEIRKMEAAEAREAELSSMESELEQSGERKTAMQAGADNRTAESATIELRRNILGEPHLMRCDGPTATKEYREAFTHYLKSGEVRALQQDDGTQGGYLLPAQQMAGLIMAIDDQVWVRKYANVLPPLTAAHSLGMASLDNDPADPDWTSELGTGDEDSTMSFGKRELQPHPLAKRIKLSNKLLRSAVGLESLVRSRFAYKFGVTEENIFLNGTGASQPLGVFTADDDGIGTGRDVSTGNDATSIKFDGLKRAKYTLKPGYRTKARWLFHTDALLQISQLKDGEGRYIWTPAVIGNEPDKLLNIPYDESQYAPNTFTTGLYVGLLADWSNYWIVDALTMTIQRLVELYAASNQTGFIARKETDGMPVLAEAFVRVKLA